MSFFCLMLRRRDQPAAVPTSQWTRIVGAALREQVSVLSGRSCILPQSQSQPDKSNAAARSYKPVWTLRRRDALFTGSVHSVRLTS